MVQLLLERGAKTGSAYVRFLDDMHVTYSNCYNIATETFDEYDTTVVCFFV